MINLINERNVIGVDCYFKGGRPVNESFSVFKELRHTMHNEILSGRHEIAVTENLVNETWNPVIDILTGRVLRDAEFQFFAYVRSLPDLDVRHDQFTFTYFIYFKRFGT